MRNQQIIDRLKKKPLHGFAGSNCAAWADKAVERFKERWPE